MQDHPVTLGILAHVDAGKTTLAEALLYTAHKIAKPGRVDHKDSVLDHYAIERERGITVFSKQARITFDDRTITLLDTPGHVDFSAEAERTLSVLDAAVLLISAPDGVQAHTLTLWRLLKQYKVPVFLFVNKTDLPDTDPAKLLSELRNSLHANILAFEPSQIGKTKSSLTDELSMCNEPMMEAFLETGTIPQALINDAVAARDVFPVFFGSALKLQGIDTLLSGICSSLPQKKAETDIPFGAKIYKISRDQSLRLTHVKITAGTLHVKDSITYTADGNTYTEKIDQIRLYDGAKYTTVQDASAGEICALTGLSHTLAGKGLGSCVNEQKGLLGPVLTYGVILPEQADTAAALSCFRSLYEELPELRVSYREADRKILVGLMGEVQLEILKQLLLTRFNLAVSFEEGTVTYQETITDCAEGIGHYEPLKHYAEVHLLLEPGAQGSGLQFATAVSTDRLDLNWQRLILTHLAEKSHAGVLGGYPITDMRITLVAGKSHIKHTEGGDFRQATYRAIRQGLMQCTCRLLEPYYAYDLEIPADQTGRAMNDIRRMYGTFGDPESRGDSTRLTGICPVSTMQNYQKELRSFTHGLGRLYLQNAGYYPCHNEEEVLASLSYDPDADLDNPSSSVFCSHGAGTLVPWYEVRDLAHVESGIDLSALNSGSAEKQDTGSGEAKVLAARSDHHTSSSISQEEIEKIYAASYRQSGEDLLPYRDLGAGMRIVSDGGKKEKPYVYKPVVRKEACLLVDGYNIIFADPELKSLSLDGMDAAREKLIDICCNYQASVGCSLILVFDAYKVKQNPGSVTGRHNIDVVYTKEGETADMYIEKTVHQMNRKMDITVATSDGLEQTIVWGSGARRISAKEFMDAVRQNEQMLRDNYLS